MAHIEHARHHRYVVFDERVAGDAAVGTGASTGVSTGISYAAAVRDFRGIVLGAIELGWPAGDDAAGAHDAAAVSASLVHAAAALSDDLGYDQRPAHT
jgi:hypothetical protein